LSGQVTSAEEGAMEGVVVSARKERSTITLSVVTDQKGQYSFPADRLDRKVQGRAMPLELGCLFGLAKPREVVAKVGTFLDSRRQKQAVNCG
jgi:hypothetical protein